MSNRGSPGSILLFRVDRIGDLLTSTPLLRALRLRYPAARIDLVASDTNGVVVADNPHLDHVFRLPLKRYWTWPGWALALRRARFDWAVDLNPSYSRTSGFFVRATGAGRRVSFVKERGESFYTEMVPHSGADHMIERQLAMAKHLGCTALAPEMEFFVPDDLAAPGGRLGEDRSAPIRVGVFVGNAKKRQTRWPEDKFTALVDGLLKDEAIEVFVLAGPQDEHLLEGFDRLWSRRCQRSPARNLTEEAAFLKTCDLLITSSSAPMHLAAAVGTPTLSILADHTYRCWRPLGPKHRSVHSGNPGVDVRDVAVDVVVDAAREALASRAGQVPD